MAFGITQPGTNQQSRTTTNSVEVAELINSSGEVEEMTTYKATAEITEDYFVSKTQAYSNTALAAQSGTSVVTNSTLTEENGAYQRYSVTTRKTNNAGK